MHDYISSHALGKFKLLSVCSNLQVFGNLNHYLHLFQLLVHSISKLDREIEMEKLLVRFENSFKASIFLSLFFFYYSYVKKWTNS